ncbi:MAG: sigma-70 family RNA polymerase sigma factor [Actinomycetales bacterium]|nr:sigma-70 family RNA polymerase sigma factor [Actinomycetales bacterium]
MTDDGDALESDALESVALTRDRAWFEELFRDHASAVHRYFLRRAPRDDAEDLAADVLATAWRRRDDVPESHQLAWLYRTAGFVLANHRRKGRPVPVGEVPEDVDGTFGVDPANLVIADAEVRDVLATLNPRERHILLLHAWEGLDGEELAHALGLSRGGAASALSRARAHLRTAWGSSVDA